MRTRFVPFLREVLLHKKQHVCLRLVVEHPRHPHAHVQREETTARILNSADAWDDGCCTGLSAGFLQTLERALSKFTNQPVASLCSGV